MRRALQATRCSLSSWTRNHRPSRKRSLHVYTHGEGFLGALGHGDFDPRSDAMPVEALASRDVGSISAGWTHSAAVCRDTGELLVWGRPFDLKQPLRINRLQRLFPLVVTGINVFASPREVLPSPVSIPLEVEAGPETGNTVAAALHDTRPTVPSAAAASSHGAQDQYQQQQQPQSRSLIRAKSVACSAALTVVLDDDGRVYCMGYNRWGQCGQGPQNEYTVFRPLRVGCGGRSAIGASGMSRVSNILEDERVVQLAVGFQQVLVLSESGKVFGWGKGLRGQLGIGGEMIEFPEEVDLPGRVVDLRSGFSHAVAVLENGDAYIWGKMQGPVLKTQGRVPLYDDQLYPRKVDIVGGGKVVEAFCSSFNTIFRTEDGRVLMSGREADTRKTIQTPVEVNIPASDPGSFFSGFNDTILKAKVPDSRSNDAPSFHRISFTSSGAKVTPFALPGLPRHSRVEEVSIGWQHTVALVH